MTDPALAVGDAVRVVADGRRGRVTRVSDTQVVALIEYQQGAVELAEAFAPDDLQRVT